MTEARHRSNSVAPQQATHRDEYHDRGKNDDDVYNRYASEAGAQSDSYPKWQYTAPQTANPTKTRTDANWQNDGALVSAVEPPLTLVETPSRTPRGDEFWVGGHWIVDAGGFAWQAGRIEQVRPGELYATGYWAPTARGWEYTEEYWR